MPIKFQPGPAAGQMISGVQAKNAQYATAVTQKQLEIDSTPVPGLQTNENLTKDVYTQYGTRLGYFESERRALDGTYPNPPVTEADLLEAATTRSGVLFPTGNLTLIPTRIPPLDGLGGGDGNNESAQLAAEAVAIAALLAMPEIDRAADPSYDDWVASLEAQQGLLQTESTAIALNESYGTGHSAWAEAQTALSNVIGFLPGPPVDTPTLTARAAAVTARQAQITARLAVLATDRVPFYDQRFLILQGRVHLVIGTLARLVAAQSGIQTLTDISGLNSTLLALYNSLV